MRYSAIVAGSLNYQPGMAAFINSFKKYHANSGIDLYVLSYDMEEEFLKRDWGIDFEVIPVNHRKGKVHACKLERFRMAIEIGGVVGIYDADMYFLDSILPYYQIADRVGLIIGGSNGSNIGFGPNWSEKYKIEIPKIFDTKTITSVPTIMRMDLHGDVWKAIYKHKEEIGTGADFDLLNIFLMIQNKLDDIFTIPCQCATGVHHFQIKPDTRIIEKAGAIITNDGLCPIMVHGRFWSGDWYHNLIRSMAKYCSRMGITTTDSRCFTGALESRSLMKRLFDELCDWEYEMTTKQATLDKVNKEVRLYLPDGKWVAE